MRIWSPSALVTQRATDLRPRLSSRITAKGYQMNAEGPYDSGHITRWLLETESVEDFLQTLADTALELVPCEALE